MRHFGLSDLLLLLDGAMWTLILSLIAIIGGGIAGFILALMRASSLVALSWPAALFIEVVQGIPLLMLLFLSFFGLPILGVNMSPLVAAGFGLTVNAAAFLGEIWRGAIQGVVKGQREAAAALGLTYWQTMRHVVLPQAARSSLSATTGFLVALIKHTSLASVLGFVELTRRSQLINNVTFQPFLVFSVAALFYYLICSPLSRASNLFGARFNGTRRNL